MLRSAASKVMWVGRATVFLVGLAVILAVLFGVASMALARDGDSFLLGERNAAQKLSTLARPEGPALSLQVQSGAPLQVNSSTRVAKLNADAVDGKHASALAAPRGYAQVSVHESDFLEPGSKGVLKVERADTGVYCFDLSFDPKVAVASGHFNNNLSVGTYTGPSEPNEQDPLDKCSPGFTDAAAKTYAANTSAPGNDWSFGIAFM